MINPSMFRCEFKRHLLTVTTKTPPEDVQQHPDLNAVHSYFHYTRGRFVCNEDFEMSQRRVRFDMNELSRLAAKATGFESCAKVEKYPDGMYNKTFLFTMHNGAEVVGKVPNPNAGRPHFTTASEVRNVLKTPAPKVLTWNANARNSVGAEYILMEKMAGIQLHQVWPSLDIKGRFVVVKALARYQKTWMSASFSRIGALYYSKDLQGSHSLDCTYTNADGQEIKDTRFAIGPCTGREFFDNGRATVEFDRGPWSSVEDYRLAIGRREIDSIASLPQLPKSPLTLCGPHSYKPTREKKIAALENYLKLVKYVLPTDESLNTSYLWHPDLHTENIYVDPNDPTRIVGLIDWQSADLLPLFDHARQPYILDYDGPQLKGLERPKLAENHKDLSPDERRRALSLYESSSLVALYRKLTYDQNKPLYRAMGYCDTISYDILVFAQNLLVDGEAHYQALVADLQNCWADLPGVRSRGNPLFPFQFSDEGLAAIENNVVAAIRGMEYMKRIGQKTGELWPEKGLVRHDQYEDAKEAIKQAKLELYDHLGLDEGERAEWNATWPFDE
ncbi:MAG: hypothetical protein LQ343_002810 [Gyalolechia ehrenbergii]|nr:MAG: hypothetical protein LQ343_002810 [Gyalolechia ehrenbergii]